MVDYTRHCTNCGASNWKDTRNPPSDGPIVGTSCANCGRTHPDLQIF